MTEAKPNYKGDRCRVMGFDAKCIKSADAGDGVHVELWGPDSQSVVGPWAVRTVDRDAGALIGLTKFEGNENARIACDEYRKAVRGY